MAITDPFATAPIDGVAPAQKLAAVTKSDSTIVNCRAFYVGGAGDVAVMGIDDTVAVTLTGCLAGQVYPIACKKIMSTNTSATAIVALY